MLEIMNYKSNHTIEGSNPPFKGGRGDFLEYNNKLKQNAKSLRTNSTLSEVLLWNKLKAKQMMGYTFNRQKPIANFIVDFYCKSLNLVIEIDGKSHDNEEKYIYDLKRDNILKSYGLEILYFEDIAVKKNINNVLEIIQNFILAKNEIPTPPLKRGIRTRDLKGINKIMN